MKVFDVVPQGGGAGERLLGAQETGSHACYLIHGVLGAGEGGRQLRPGPGHEELVLVVSGALTCTGVYAGTLREGQALQLQGEETVVAAAVGAGAVYVIAGGHTAAGHH